MASLSSKGVLALYRMTREVLIELYANMKNRHMAKYDFARAEKMFGVEIREGHTVVEKWPWKLKLAPGEKGRDEVEWWIGGGVSGKERYVEWRKR